MKRVIMHKWNAVRTGKWGWSIKAIWNESDNIYSDPYYVEVPDNFTLSETAMCEAMYFKLGCQVGYEVSNFSDGENCKPYLIGGSPVETIKLQVIEPVED